MENIVAQIPGTISFAPTRSKLSDHYNSLFSFQAEQVEPREAAQPWGGTEKASTTRLALYHTYEHRVITRGFDSRTVLSALPT